MAGGALPEDVVGVAEIVVRQSILAGLLRRCDYRDALSDAQLGVVLALRDYDPTKGAALRTYAFDKAKWAILDGVRLRGPVSRYWWSHGVRDIDELPVGHRPPTSLYDEDGVPMDPLDEGAGRAFEAVEARMVVATLLAGLSEKERRVVVQRFFQGRTTEDIGAELGVTPSRISQIVTLALYRMRARLTANQ